jgi:hypothetical protein
MRTAPRRRRYVSSHWLSLLAPVLRYSFSRDAYLLRVVGNRMGPVLRVDRRLVRRQVEGVERRRAHAA